MKKIISLVALSFILFSNNGFAAFNQAPAIELPGVDKNVKLEDFKGKVVYLDFWASWCVPCKKSFPWMDEIRQKYSEKGFEIIAVNLDKDRSAADDFLKELDVSFTLAFDQSGDSAAQYKLKGMPTSYLIGCDGKVYASHIGFRDKDKVELEKAIVNLINKK